MLLTSFRNKEVLSTSLVIKWIENLAKLLSQLIHVMYMYVHGPHLVWPISWGLNKTSVSNCTCSSSILSTWLVIQPSFVGGIMRKLQGLQKELSGRLSCWASIFPFSLAQWARAWASLLPTKKKCELRFTEGKQNLRATCPTGRIDFNFFFRALKKYSTFQMSDC